MALHSNLTSLLKESLPEVLEAARYCIEYSKDSSWGATQKGGCLGYPGTALLLSLADSLGSYHRERKGYSVIIDGKEYEISRDGFQHFFIFNSSFYGLSLSLIEIQDIYKNYRNLLLHNSALAQDHFLFMGQSNQTPFQLSNGKVHINVIALLRVTQQAVQSFLHKAHDIVPNSNQEKIIKKK
jgi:hypothetical protein